MTSPRIEIAPPQLGNQLGTWAYRTISTRFGETAKRILVENHFSLEIEGRLSALIRDIPDTPIRYINDPGAPDENTWRNYVEPYTGLDWHQPPWFFTEHYFYRRILEATGYFQRGDGYRVDPFITQKRGGLEVARDSIHQLFARTDAWRKADPRNPDTLIQLVYLDLWGNQADYSLWPAEGDDKPDHVDLDQARAHILVDDASRLVDLILKFNVPQSRLDFLLDNAGFELVSDLALADYLIAAGLVSTVCLHAKAHPTYVSDAMKKDVLETIAFFVAEDHSLTAQAGSRLSSALKAGKLQISENYFWNSPLDAWKMPGSLREELSQANLVISKGDANYRRLLGDRHWPYETAFEDIVSYFPAPLVALRTLKSELICGLKPGQADRIAAQDLDWLIDGRWGVVQLAQG